MNAATSIAAEATAGSMLCPARARASSSRASAWVSRIVAQGAHRPDQVAAQLAIEVRLPFASLPAEALERRTHEIANGGAEPLTGIALHESVAPAKAREDRLPDRRRRLLREPRDQVQERRHARIAGHDRRPCVVHEALALAGRQVRCGPRQQSPAQFVVVEGPHERGGTGIGDDQRIGVRQGEFEAVRLHEDVLHELAVRQHLSNDERDRPGRRVVGQRRCEPMLGQVGSRRHRGATEIAG